MKHPFRHAKKHLPTLRNSLTREMALHKCTISNTILATVDDKIRPYLTINLTTPEVQQLHIYFSRLLNNCTEQTITFGREIPIESIQFPIVQAQNFIRSIESFREKASKHGESTYTDQRS